MDVPKSQKFCCNFFVRMAKSVPVIFILCILSWSYYAYVFNLCYSHIASLEIRVLYLLVYHVILFFFLWSYFKTIFTEPGGAPPKFRLPEEVFEEFNRYPVDLGRQHDILRNFAENLPIMTFTNTDEIRFCDKCRTVKPDRSHHCSVCRKCVLKMDHHCPWVNNCVSYSNYKFFILFLAYGLMLCLYVVSTTAEFVIKFWNNPDATHKTHNIHVVFLFFIAAMFSVSLFSLFAYHLYLVSKNRTTLESFRPPKFSDGCDKNGFNLGCCKNIQEVFGKEFILWPFPIDTSLGEGVSFPINKKVPEAQSLLFSDIYDQKTSIDMEFSDTPLYTSILINDEMNLAETNTSKCQDLIQI